MSQRGKRNYRPNRLNDNQTDKDIITEEETVVDVVDETVVEEIEPEIKTEDIIEVEIVEEFKEVNKIKKLISQPQIVKPEPQLSGEQWIDQVLITDAEMNHEVSEVTKQTTKEVTKEVTEDWIQKAIDTDVQMSGEVKQEVKKQANKVTVKEKKEKIKAEKPHYVYDRNEEGNPTRITQEAEKMKPKVDERRLRVLNRLLGENEVSVLNQEVEIEIFRKMRDKENNPQKIESLEKRIEIFNSQLDDLKLRQLSIKEMMQE